MAGQRGSLKTAKSQIQAGDQVILIARFSL